MRVGVGAHGVLAEDEEAAQAPFDHGRETLGGLEAGRAAELCAPGCLELRDDLGVCHLLVAGEVGGHGTHVAGALHVVLAADGVHAAALASQLAAGHGDVGERHDAFGAAGVFRHAQTVEDGGALGTCVHVGGGHEVVLADAADACDLVGRVVGHERLEGLEPFGLLRDEVAVHEAVAHHNVDHAVGKGHIGAGIQLEMDVRLRGEFDVARVHHDELAAALHSGANLHAQDRVRLLGVGAHE